MNSPQLSMAQQIGTIAGDFQARRTGHRPKSVIVVLSHDTLVITFQDALTPAEKTLAQTAEGAAQVQDFHRQLFAASSEMLRQEIQRITGVKVREAAAEVEPATGAVVHAFTAGAMVQVFLLADPITDEVWNAPGDGGAAETTTVQR